MKRVMIAGMGGQLGFELKRVLEGEGMDSRLRGNDENKCGNDGHLNGPSTGRGPAQGPILVAPTEGELDITDSRAVRGYVGRERPDVIINCAAYAAVDKAEGDRERAFAVNRDGPENLALAAAVVGARLIHVSTDFVFAGDICRALRPDDRPNPLSVYGSSKLAGEEKVLAALPGALVIRTAWLYSSFGNNFVKTMLRLMNERDSLGVVVDQIGTPTWAGSLAEVIVKAVASDSRGILHWSDAGVASWYDFAAAIYEEGRRLGLVKKETAIRPITTAEYPTPAVRPAFSVLDKSLTCSTLAVTPVHWRTNLIRCLEEIGAIC